MRTAYATACLVVHHNDGSDTVMPALRRGSGQAPAGIQKPLSVRLDSRPSTVLRTCFRGNDAATVSEGSVRHAYGEEIGVFDSRAQRALRSLSADNPGRERLWVG